MSENVLIAVILAMQAIMVAIIGVIGVLLGKVRKDAAEVRDHVSNDHDQNMRDDNDQKHTELVAMIRGVRRHMLTEFKRVNKSVGGVRDDARILRADHDRLDNRVSDMLMLEITEDRRR